jgi:hypothetical protein
MHPIIIYWLRKAYNWTRKENSPSFHYEPKSSICIYTQYPIITDRQLIISNQPLDYLDNTNLGAIEFRSLYHRAISRSKLLWRCVKFAKIKPHIPFDIKYDYPQLTRIYLKTKILKLNGFSLAVGEWTEVPYFQLTTK